MYSKMALKNVKKSFKDYTIYFLTLTLSVCIFYSFNSIGAQKALQEVSSSGKEFTETITAIISYISIFVSIILGGLILYANNFLIKKRNKELGIYMTLGMGKNKISRILIMETLIVGVMSLISGLLLGIIASQGLSVLISKMFYVSMNDYKFVISVSAIYKTILYFGVMFLLVMIFNTIVISKYKIIDLLTVGRKTQDIKVKNPLIFLGTFIISISSLVIAYKFVLSVGVNIDNPKFTISIILGVVGTTLFFFSLAGAILFIVKRNKNIYFNKLNIFTVKQINSKINTNFISMSVICLMLFLTISILSTGISFKNTIEKGLEASTPYDVSMRGYGDDENLTTILDFLKKMDFEIDEKSEYVEFNQYGKGLYVRDLIPLEGVKIVSGADVKFVKLSDYNKLRELRNEETFTLENDEVLAISDSAKVIPVLDKLIKDREKIKFDNNDYSIKNKKVIEENLVTDYPEMFKKNFLTIVTNDSILSDAEIMLKNININYNDGDSKAEDKRYKELSRKRYSRDLMSMETNKDDLGLVMINTRTDIYDNNKSVTTIMLFVGMYIGIVFLISSMAILALQQLSEASDSVERYEAIKKLGASKKDINKTIFTQTLVYFSLPVILAIVHSIVGIKVACGFLTMYNRPDIGGSASLTAGIFLVIYIGYFYATYTGYKNIVKMGL
ncbi:FtsX-like permease family protein [Clostridium ihumii]|uniref:FtsX-like permease family protein n=1 Tax=Clostridium ihumii TaxID=1470356 RepID=UPI000590A611|nr:ABC transporter permease [Clostridium ihumii]